MKKGAIVIHGLTGAPAMMAPLTEGLAKAGFNVVSPLLPGHGTGLSDLIKTNYTEWIESVNITYDKLKKDSDEIYCAGLSLGALLTLNLALDGQRPLKKIACLGTPLKFSPLLEKFLLPLSHIPPIKQILRYSKKDWEASVKDPSGREIYKNSSYPKIPIASVWEIQKLQKIIVCNLPKLKIPMLLLHSENDKVAPPFNVNLICSQVKIGPQVVWLYTSEHVITLDSESRLVVESVLKFFSN